MIIEPNSIGRSVYYWVYYKTASVRIKFFFNDLMPWCLRFGVSAAGTEQSSGSHRPLPQTPLPRGGALN